MNAYYLCKTKEEYDWLMKKLEKEGFKWRAGGSPTEKNNFLKYGDGTVVKEEDGRKLMFAEINFYLEEDGLELSDFISVSELMKEKTVEKVEAVPKVVYLVQKTVLKNRSVKVTDGVFRTFQAAEKNILDQGGKPLGFFGYESDEFEFEIEQFELLEVRE